MTHWLKQIELLEDEMTEVPPRKLTAEDIAASNRRAEESLKWQQLFVDAAMHDYESRLDLQDEGRRMWLGLRNALLIMAACALGIWLAWRYL